MFNHLFEEALGQDNIQRLISLLEPQDDAEFRLLISALRSSVLDRKGNLLPEIVSGKPGYTSVIVKLNELTIEYMAREHAEYSDLLYLEEQAGDRARQELSNAKKIQQQALVIRAQEKLDGTSGKRLSRRVARMIHSTPTADELDFEYQKRLEAAAKCRRATADIATLRKRAEMQIEPQLHKEPNFCAITGEVASRVAPGLLDEVILPYMAKWLEEDGPKVLNDLRSNQEEAMGMGERRIDEPIVSEQGKPLADVAGAPGPEDRRSVFLVHGRDATAAGAMRDLLRALGLKVILWEDAVQETGDASPYVGEVVLAGMRLARTVVILFSPDDLVRLRPDLANAEEDSAEVELSGQARANVIYEAGISDALDRTRTVLVELGRVKSPSDLSGRHVVRLDASPQSRHRLATRLTATGLDVDLNSDDWLRAGDFSSSLEAARSSLQ
ncbi:TIR domain-containing protein [Streptomyces sp. NPDC056387]|uniref:TIR domain-containing protein n=1 Tax=Streptomyces sp. NPDC056387 TaxID=3345803 RepID=UPI0035D6C91A